MYRIKIKVQTHPLNTHVTRLLLAATSVFTTVIVGFKLYRIAFPHGEITERELHGWFDRSAFVPDALPTDLLPDMYTLSINVTNVTFSGNVTIKLICRRNTSYLVLHAAPTLFIYGVKVEDRTEGHFATKVFDRLRDKDMLIIKATDRQFIPPRTYVVSMSFIGKTPSYPEHQTGLLSVKHPGGYESIMFINEARASRQVFPSFNRHRFRAGFRLEGLVRRGMVLCSSERPVHDQDDVLVEDNGGPNDVFRVRFTTIDAITSDRLAWFQTNLVNSALGSVFVMWNTAEHLVLMNEALELLEESHKALSNIYQSLTIPARIHVVHVPDYERTIVCWGIIYSSRFEGSTKSMLKYRAEARRLRFQFQASAILASFTFGHTISPRWANDIWFFAGLSAAIAYDSMEDLESFGVHKSWLANFRHRAFQFTDAMNRLTPDTFDFVGLKDETMLSNAFLLFLLYKDCLVGREKFRLQVGEFVSKYKFTSTNSDSAVNILTGRSTYLKGYFDTWANKHGHPVVVLQVTSDAAGKSTVTIRQVYFQANFASTHDTWLIPFLPTWVFLNGTVKQLERRVLTGDIDTVITIGPLQEGALLPFYNMASVTRVLYDSHLWGMTFALLDSPEFTAVPVVNRASLQQDLGALLRNGDVGLTVYIAGIRYMWRENSRAVWRAFAREYRQIRETADEVPLRQLDGLIKAIMPWHRPADMDNENATYDQDTRPFFEEVLCLSSGRAHCPQPDAEYDEWSFYI